MLKGVLFLASAGGVALVALIGHWQTDTPVGHDGASTATSAPPQPAGVPWLPIVLIICALGGVIALWLAWKRRGVLPAESFTAPPKPAPTTRSGVHGRWHCILTVNGHEARRGYIDLRAPDHETVADEIESRFRAMYAADLPPDAHIRARVVPVYSK